MIEDEMQMVHKMVLKEARALQEAELTKLLMEPRRPYSRSAGIRPRF
ncbi:hypothetical protein ACFY1P_20645 [Streptomyces sp. NPDC001407]